MITIILNGKKAGIESLRNAIDIFRQEVKSVEVRVTYEYGDVERFMLEAIKRGTTKIIIGGGDGSVNEIVNAMIKLPIQKRPKLAILPLGTANDFATACGIPMDSLEALRFAISNDATLIDIAKANDRYFVNIATAGFGAEVTSQTPVELKNFLGGGAYTLMGMLKAVDFVPYKGKMKTPYFEIEQSGVVAGICNGRQAGGGQVLAPKAKINDGLLDVIIIKEIPLGNLAQFRDEMESLSMDGEYVQYFQTPWIESQSEDIIPINLDGEPYNNKTIRFEIVANAIKLVLPSNSQMLV